MNQTPQARYYHRNKERMRKKGLEYYYRNRARVKEFNRKEYHFAKRDFAKVLQVRHVLPKHFEGPACCNGHVHIGKEGTEVSWCYSSALPRYQCVECQREANRRYRVKRRSVL